MDLNKTINADEFPPTIDKLNFVDHISKFLGLAVAQLYLLCALITCFEVISRYVFEHAFLIITGSNVVGVIII